MRVEAQDVSIVAGAGFTLVGVADRVLLHRRVARHEAPLHAGGEARATATTQTRSLDGLDHLLARHLTGEDFAPRRVAADLLVGLERPGAFETNRLEHDQIHPITPGIHRVAHGSPSRILSTFSGVRFS